MRGRIAPVKLPAFLVAALAWSIGVGFAQEAARETLFRFSMEDGSGRWGAKRFGYRAADGLEVVPAIYQAADEFVSEGVAAVARNGRAGLVDRSGREIIATTMDAEEIRGPDVRRLNLPGLREGFSGEPLAVLLRTEAGYRGHFASERTTELPVVDFRREFVVGLASCSFCSSRCDHAHGRCHRNSCSYRRAWWAVRIR